MKKKLIVIGVALVAIALILIFGVGVGGEVKEKYSYSNERADLKDYFGVSGDQLAIILQDARISDNALNKDGVCYFSLDTIENYIGEGFYFDPNYNAGTLMFTTGEGTYEAIKGESSYSYNGESNSFAHPVVIDNGDEIFISADYVAKFMTYEYKMYDLHVQVYTEWGNSQQMTITKDTQLRYQGGVKSPILRDVKKGEVVELLDEMENWSKVKTEDSYIGYIENKKMDKADVKWETAPTEVVLPVHNPILLNKKVNLGFHSVAGVSGNDTIYEMMNEAKGMNVIAPTWFSMNDNAGGIRNFGSTDYVAIAHGQGYQVWAVLDDFNYKNETGDSISDLEVLSNTVSRRALEENVVAAAVALGIDGINLDFEVLTSEGGEHYSQFLKELSVLCSQKNLILSADNYVPFNFNSFYHLDTQGKYLDYVLIMGYDEHYHGSGNPGSVASLGYVTNGIDKTLEYVAPEQVINILPLYTIVWKNDGGNITDSYLTVVNEDDYINKLGITYSWDEESGQNFAEWKSGGVTHSLWLEDAESIRAKINVMHAREIGGVAVWRLGYGNEAVWDVIAAYSGS